MLMVRLLPTSAAPIEVSAVTNKDFVHSLVSSYELVRAGV